MVTFMRHSEFISSVPCYSPAMGLQLFGLTTVTNDDMYRPVHAFIRAFVLGGGSLVVTSPEDSDMAELSELASDWFSVFPAFGGLICSMPEPFPVVVNPDLNQFPLSYPGTASDWLWSTALTRDSWCVTSAPLELFKREVPGASPFAMVTAAILSRVAELGYIVLPTDDSSCACIFGVDNCPPDLLNVAIQDATECIYKSSWYQENKDRLVWNEEFLIMECSSR